MQIRHFQFIPCAIAAFALSATVTLAGETGINIADSKLGPILTNADGMTLYTYDKDMNGKSACNGGCAGYWPPLIAPAGAKADDDFTLIKRKDGKMQWAYYGKPLYLWAKDKAPGDVTGDGKGKVWHAAVKE